MQLLMLLTVIYRLQCNGGGAASLDSGPVCTTMYASNLTWSELLCRSSRWNTRCI